MVATTLPGVLLTGIHSARPAANGVGTGALYSCSTHSLVYQSDGSTWSTWANVGGTGFANPMTTLDDIIVGGASGAPGRLAKGSDGQVLTVDPSTHHLVWATPSAGFTNPMTTKGDVIVADTGGTALRKAVGSDGQVLTADAASTGGIKWAAAGGGGGALAAHPMPLDAYAIDGTYGDDFTGASLNTGLWTRRNYVSGNEAYQVGPAGTYLRLAQSARSNGDGYFQTVPAGAWTFAMAFVPRFFWTANIGFGIAAVNSSGTGVATTFYGTTPYGFLLTTVTTYTTYGGAFTGPGISGTPGAGTSNLPINYMPDDRKVWISLRHASGNFYAAISMDGELWSPESPAMASGVTLDRVGMFCNPLGQAKNTNSDISSYIDVDWFNKIA